MGVAGSIPAILGRPSEDEASWPQVGLQNRNGVNDNLVSFPNAEFLNAFRLSV